MGIAVLVLAAVLCWSFTQTEVMLPNLLSELAGIALSTILALVGFTAIDRQREAAAQKRIRDLSKGHTADLIHNFIISLAVQYPIPSQGEILAEVMSLSPGGRLKETTLDTLIQQIKDVEIPSREGTLIEKDIKFYEGEKDNLNQISGLVGQQVRHLHSRPGFGEYIFKFDITRANLERLIALQKSDSLPVYIKPDTRIHSVFLDMLNDINDLYKEIITYR
jgi:hypothetical protein